MVGKPQKSAKGSTELAKTTKTKPQASKSKSPSRAKSPGRPKSPSRVKKEETRVSPASRTAIRRSPSRRSPSRKSKSPARDVKVVEEKLPERVVRTKKQIIIESDSESDSAEVLKKEVKEKPKAAVRGRTRRIDIELEPLRKIDVKKDEGRDEINSYGLIRRSTRHSQNREIERVVHLKSFESTAISKKLGEFSDEDDLIALKHSQLDLPESLNEKPGFGIIGAVFIIIASILVPLSLQIVCQKTKCSFIERVDLSKLTSPSFYLGSKSILGYTAYITIYAILTALPFGGKRVSGLPNKQGKIQYITNGLFSFVVLLAIAVGLEVKGIALADFIINNYFRLTVASLLTGVMIALYSYVRSFYVPLSALNTKVVGKSGLYSFCLGREVNPRLGGVIDLKVFTLRLLFVGTILLDLAFLYKSLDVIKIATPESQISTFDLRNLTIRPTLIVLVVLHLIYNLDALILENTWVTTSSIQYEGFGYFKAVCHLIVPFLTTLQTKYVLEHKLELATWKLGLISLTFLLGYVLYRGSNSQKDAFRKNPYSPSLSHLDTIPTTQGKKLLASGFWGIVRHPNYLGDILIQLSFVPFVLCVPPVLAVYLNVITLILRAKQDNAICKKKYGSAWDRYCSRVKYLLVPKVY